MNDKLLLDIKVEGKDSDILKESHKSETASDNLPDDQAMLAIETDETTRVYCPDCDKSFSNAKHQHSHYQLEHSGDQCEKTFSKKVNLQVHINLIHKKNQI